VNLLGKGGYNVARLLEERRAFPVVEVLDALDALDALDPLAQPELLKTVERDADLVVRRTGDAPTTLLAPLPNKVE